MKSTKNALVDVQGSLVDIETLRSRAAIVADIMSKVTREEQDIELKHPLRVTASALRSPCHAMVAQGKEQLGERLSDTKDIEKAEELTQFVANKVGEQLVLYTEKEEEEAE